ncbi:hypothetical protein ACFL3B_00415 [Gemmatimonadota bacterium]
MGKAGVKAATNSAYTDAAREFNLAIATSPELARALGEWPESPTDATAVDQVQVLGLMRALLHMWSNGYRQYRAGTLDPTLMDALKQEVSTFAIGASDNPAIIQRAKMLNYAWSLERFLFPPSFQHFVDDLLTSGGTANAGDPTRPLDS